MANADELIHIRQSTHLMGHDYCRTNADEHYLLAVD